MIRHVLQLPVDIFLTFPAKTKFKTYQLRWQAGDISITGSAKKTEDNPQGLGCYLVMSGRGCDDMSHILESEGKTFADMFHLCERWFGTGYHLTRLDIAIDDQNDTPFFTVEQIKKKCEKGEYIANGSEFRFHESRYNEHETAKTVYIGAGKSEQSYRFYDKDKEVSKKYNKPIEEIGSWKRTEIQLRDSKAHAFALLFMENPYDLGQLAVDLLAGNLRFVVSNSAESNRSRWKTCRFWQRFLGAVKPLKLHAPQQDNTLSDTQKWLKEGGGISAVKGFCFLEEHDALGDLERVGDMLDKARYSPDLACKLTGHLQRIDRSELIPYVEYDTKRK